MMSDDVILDSEKGGISHAWKGGVRTREKGGFARVKRKLPTRGKETLHAWEREGLFTIAVVTT